MSTFFFFFFRCAEYCHEAKREAFSSLLSRTKWFLKRLLLLVRFRSLRQAWMEELWSTSPNAAGKILRGLRCDKPGVQTWCIWNPHIVWMNKNAGRFTLNVTNSFEWGWWPCNMRYSHHARVVQGHHKKGLHLNAVWRWMSGCFLYNWALWRDCVFAFLLCSTLRCNLLLSERPEYLIFHFTILRQSACYCCWLFRSSLLHHLSESAYCWTCLYEYVETFGSLFAGSSMRCSIRWESKRPL